MSKFELILNIGTIVLSLAIATVAMIKMHRNKKIYLRGVWGIGRPQPYWSTELGYGKVWRCPCTLSEIEEGKDWSCDPTIERCSRCGADRPLEKEKEPCGT